MNEHTSEYAIYLNYSTVRIDRKLSHPKHGGMDFYEEVAQTFNLENSEPELVLLAGVERARNILKKHKIKDAKLRFRVPSHEIAEALSTGTCTNAEHAALLKTYLRHLEADGHSVEAIEVDQTLADMMTEDLEVIQDKPESPELWKIIEGTNGLYEISSRGRPYSHHTKGRRAKEGFLKPVFVTKGRYKDGTRRGYYHVSIHVPGRPMIKRRIDHLVLEAFHGSRPEGCEACHYDDDPANNRAGNLYWGTRSSNRLDGKFNNPPAGCTVTRIEPTKQVRYWDHELEKVATVSG